MNPFEAIGQSSASAMRAQSRRLQTISENISNVDTHGYHRKLVAFGPVFNSETGAKEIGVSDVFLDQSEPNRAFDPSNPFADSDGYVERSNVDLMTEIADAREANRSFDAAMEVFRQARGMFNSLIELLKR